MADAVFRPRLPSPCGQGLPDADRPVAALIAHSITIGLYPIVQFFFKKSYRRIRKDLPFFDVDSI